MESLKAPSGNSSRLKPDDSQTKSSKLVRNHIPLYDFDVLLSPEYAHLFEGERQIGVVFTTIIKNVHGKSVRKVKQTIKAVKADARLAESLNMQKEDPVLQFEQVWYGFDEKVFMAATTFYSSENFHFVMELEQKR